MIDIFYQKKIKTASLILEKYPNAIPVDSAKDCYSLKYCWYIDNDIILDKNFTITYKVEESEETYIHQFENNGIKGLYLIPYRYKFKKDLYGEFENKKIISTDAVFYSSINYDIFFLSCGESYAEEHFQLLKNRFPFVRRIDGVKGIYAAHKVAAIKSTTSHFWVVDADVLVSEQFYFNYSVNPQEFDVVHIWHSRNDINDAVYGNGGIKLLPKFLFDIEHTGKVDITTGLSDQIKILPEVTAIHAIGTSPYVAWRSAFREAVKLTLQADAESQKRLQTWMTKGLSKPNGGYAVLGAKAGNKYAQSNSLDTLKIAKINDYAWLHSQFKETFPKLLIAH
jgi:hypothetical protein